MFRLLPGRDARLLLALLVLVLVPGVTLAYLGLRGVSERENSLRVQYLATAMLVRDRLAAEFAGQEQQLGRSVGTNGARPFPGDPPLLVKAWLEGLERDRPWLTRAFFIQGDGLVTRSLHAGSATLPSDPLATAWRAAALTASAESSEFVHRDLDAALRQYRDASAHIPDGSPQAAFLLTRVGRTLLKMKRAADAIAPYRQAVADADGAVDRNGLPFAVIALVQIADAYAALGRTDDQAKAERDLLEYVVDHPWNLADGFGAYLDRALSAPGSADPELLARGRALALDVAEFEWPHSEIGPRIHAARRGVEANEDTPGHVVVQRYGQKVLVGFRPVDAASVGPRVLGYVVKPDGFGGDRLERAAAAVGLDRDLTVRVMGHDAFRLEPSTPAGPEPLANAPFPADAPGTSDCPGRRPERNLDAASFHGLT